MRKTPNSATPEIEIGQVVLLPPEVLEPTPDQPRQKFSEDDIRGMANNAINRRAKGQGIQETGFIDPLKLRLPANALDAEGRLKEEVRLPIYSGETRWHAANYANSLHAHSLPLLPCIIENVSEEDALELAYFANAQRKNLSELDDAIALLRIKNRHRYTMQQMTLHMNLSMGELQNRLDVAGDKEVWEIFDGRKNALSMARRITQVKDPELKRSLIKRAKKKSTTFAEIDEIIKAHSAGVSVEKYRARQQVTRYEKQGEGEARKANQTGKRGDALQEDATSFAEEIASLAQRANQTREELRGMTFTSRERRELASEHKKLVAAVARLGKALEQIPA
jgi:ParB/RepB/Spo0J family partition protein